MVSWYEIVGERSHPQKAGQVRLNTFYETRKKPLWLVVLKLCGLTAEISAEEHSLEQQARDDAKLKEEWERLRDRMAGCRGPADRRSADERLQGESGTRHVANHRLVLCRVGELQVAPPDSVRAARRAPAGFDYRKYKHPPEPGGPHWVDLTVGVTALAGDGGAGLPKRATGVVGLCEACRARWLPAGVRSREVLRRTATGCLAVCSRTRCGAGAYSG